MNADRERRKYRWLGLLGVGCGVGWLFYSFSWFTLGVRGGDFATRWGEFWGRMLGTAEGISVVGIGYLILTGFVYIGLLTFTRNPDSYRVIALFLAISSGVSTVVVPLVAIPLLLR